MKKILKITGLALVVLALVSNLHSALFTFYGIKTNNLTGQVWAQSTSTDGTSSSSNGGSGSSSNDIFWDETTVGCHKTEVTMIPVKTYANASSTASIGFTGTSVASVSLGAGGTFSQTNEYIAIITNGTEDICTLSFMAICDKIACNFAPGTKADHVILNGRTIFSTSGN